MAELEVRPKKKSPLIWILLILVILALLYFFMRGSDDFMSSGKAGKNTVSDTTAVATTVTEWDSVDFNAPPAVYEEVTDHGIEVQGNDKYAIYSLGENVLFATDKSDIQSPAQVQLKQIASSLKKRYDGASIAVYGNTDSTGTTSHNKELGKERAESVKNWLVSQAGIAEDKIIIHSKGESDAPATNETAKGRQLNRSVQIVALINKK